MTASPPSKETRSGSSLGLSPAWGRALLVLVLAGSLLILLARPPMPQDPAYYDFADRREFLGIPNFLDVATNLPFLVVGVAGLASCTRRRPDIAPRAWQVFFAGVALVGLGSAWFHLEPNARTLVWDRLPMTLGFMGLFIALLAEHVHPRAERLLLWPALAVGALSVAWWAYRDDLRLYAWVQLAPLLAVPLAVLLFPGRHTHRWLLLGALGLYVLAKAVETLDRDIFRATAGVFSGHSLKHLLAGAGIGCLYWMVRGRRGREPPSEDRGTGLLRSR